MTISSGPSLGRINLLYAAVAVWQGKASIREERVSETISTQRELVVSLVKRARGYRCPYCFGCLGGLFQVWLGAAFKFDVGPPEGL